MTANISIIIDRPDLQNRFQRTVFGVVTLALWTLWAYLWLPLVTGLLWLVGIRVAYFEIFRGTRGIDLTNLLWTLLLSVLVMTFWSSYNAIRYGKRTRRCRTEIVPRTSVARAFGVYDSETIEILTRQRNLELLFSATGQLSSVMPLSNPQSSEEVVWSHV